MKVTSIKKFKAKVHTDPYRDEMPAAPRHGQLVNIKGELTQFVEGEKNCIGCYYTDKACERIACGSGHYRHIQLPTTPFTAPKEQV